MSMSESTKYMWVVRPTDDRTPTAPFSVWSSEDGRVYADLGGEYELVKSGPAESPYIQYWLDDRNPTHPIIDELRARPGAWAVLGHCGKGEGHGPEWQAAYNACKRHPNVQMVGILEAGHSDSPIRARWLPDPVVAAMQVLKGGGYGG